MNKFLKISVIMLFVIALLITGGILMSKDKKPLHEQIAEYMFNSRALPKLEYCVEKYGDEFELSDVGSVISTRFPAFKVRLVWSEEEQTYKDDYIVYLQKEEIESILFPLAYDVFSECKLFAYPYHVCPSYFDKNTTAIELLSVSEKDGPVVQIDIFTTKDPSQKDSDVQEFTKSIQKLGYSVCVNIEYLSNTSYEMVNGDNHRSSEVISKTFYRYFGSILILPDSFNWVPSNSSWREGEG